MPWLMKAPAKKTSGLAICAFCECAADAWAVVKAWAAVTLLSALALGQVPILAGIMYMVGFYSAVSPTICTFVGRNDFKTKMQ